MKKLLAFLILLMVGMALFAVPIVGETAISITAETPHFADGFNAVTDVSLFAKADYSPVDINYFQVTAVNDNLFTATNADICLYRREAYPLSGYSKAGTSEANRYLQLAIEGWT